jgi:hypothetical protein
MKEWVIGVVLNLGGSVVINLGTNLMKLSHNKKAAAEAKEQVGHRSIHNCTPRLGAMQAHPRGASYAIISHVNGRKMGLRREPGGVQRGCRKYPTRHPATCPTCVRSRGPTSLHLHHVGSITRLPSLSPGPHAPLAPPAEGMGWMGGWL